MNGNLYATHADRLDTVIGETKSFWLQIKNAKQDYDNQPGQNPFYFWLQENYGIRLNYFVDGSGYAGHDIVDQQKYLLFLLKYQNQS